MDRRDFLKGVGAAVAAVPLAAPIARLARLAPEAAPVIVWGAREYGTPVVTAPNGAIIETTGSRTQGLQEAFDFACANGCNILITGDPHPGSA